MKDDSVIYFVLAVVIFVVVLMLFPKLRGHVARQISPKRKVLGHAQKGNDSGGVLTSSDSY